MKHVVIFGWKQGAEVPPLTLLRVLRAGLGVDLVTAKGLLDKFAKDGELHVEAEGNIATRLQRLMKDAEILSALEGPSKLS
jgi:hypothetical protein